METEPDDLPTLTSKQRAFVNALLKGKTASDAYRDAYNCTNMSQGAIWVEASRLRRNTKVSLWLRHFQRIGMDAARITIEGHLAELGRARELAFAHGHISAGVQAEHYRGKAVGLYDQAVRLDDAVSDIELLKAIEAALGMETAHAIGAALVGD